ncbi:MAG: universal stress protein [Cyclobacteriaceae bacterium]|nr:universal stress protein [Cyclobacteriaceae bacterium]MCX7637642.1 universal stress protein [Cyclobacteriaceae bacterium]MDW8331805.1 universal stress protein [Cyclobacteriaceae bacterium]
MKILVPTDFSACAQTAAEVAMAVAQQMKAELIFLHLHETPGRAHVPSLHEAADSNIGQTRALLEELVNQAGRLNIPARQMLVTHQGGDKIENYISPLQVNLIIMGSHGATGIREWVIGSQTQRVVRHATVPVLVIKQKPSPVSFKNILYATTTTEDLVNALRQLQPFVQAFGAGIHMVNIQFPEKEAEQKAAEAKMKMAGQQFSDIRFTYNSIITNDPEWGINKLAQEVKADLIALTTEIKTGSMLFPHKLAEDLVNHEPLPVLVINLA